VPLDQGGNLPVLLCGGSQQGGLALAGRDKQNVLDSAMLECLAVIATAHDRSLAEELNLAVRSYVLNQFAEHGEGRLVERAFSDQPAATV
jgi:hypothetical protein